MTHQNLTEKTLVAPPKKKKSMIDLIYALAIVLADHKTARLLWHYRIAARKGSTPDSEK